jgi:hypothetical protein
MAASCQGLRFRLDQGKVGMQMRRDWRDRFLRGASGSKARNEKRKAVYRRDESAAPPKTEFLRTLLGTNQNG